MFFSGTYNSEHEASKIRMKQLADGCPVKAFGLYLDVVKVERAGGGRT